MAGSRKVSPAEMWLLTKIAGPDAGMLSAPLIEGLNSSRHKGRKRHPFEHPVQQDRPPLRPNRRAETTLVAGSPVGFRSGGKHATIRS